MRLVELDWFLFRKISLFATLLRRHVYFVLGSSVTSSVKLFAGKSSLFFIAKVLKTFSGFRYDVLTELCVVDMPDKERRYRAIYSFLSSLYGDRVFLNIYLVEATLVNSLRSLYASAGWLEREA